MNLRLLLEKSLYRLAWLLALPVLPVRLFLRGLKEPGYFHHWAERFGGGQVVPNHPAWIHAVSVGEMQAAAPLVLALQSHYPEIPILLTCMTATGREAAHRLYGEAVPVRYLPYDFPWAVNRFLQRNRPCLGVLMETEIWPTLVSICYADRIPMYLANARLSEKSAQGYGRLPELMRDTLGKFSAVAAQYENDAKRLQSLGAENVRVTGSLKFDLHPPQTQIDQGRLWRQIWGTERPVLLAASTREGEEELILKAFAAHAPVAWLLVLVPRHPQRFDEVAALIAKAGLRYQRRSQTTRTSVDTHVLLGDSMGEMISYYAACDVAFIGGSLLPYGGQNLIEATACGVPVLMGPHTHNFARIAEMAEAHGAAQRVADADELIAAARGLLQGRQEREAMSQDALRFAEAHRGATEKVMTMIAGDLH
jgi:3-deoxy-D-manno-octulosonic-acid transferase